MILTGALSAAPKAGVLGPIVVMFGFHMWFGLTLGILVGMEGLSAFLHTLRLHWYLPPPLILIFFFLF
jgi:vacuolar-type H+-ATPase subunit I/STV1